MDLIYTNEDREDVGVITDYSLDTAFGEDENDFELTLALGDDVLDYGYYIYISKGIEKTPYAGVVDKVVVDTQNNTVVYSGRSIQGVLENKIICPDANQDYYIVSGSIKTILTNLITRVGLNGLVVVDNSTNKTVSSYQFDRYINLYKGLIKFLKSQNMKLNMYFYDGKIHIGAVDLVDYSQDEEWDSSQMTFKITKSKNYVNHLICLGKGELKDREIIHLYRDEDDNISKTQTYTGNDEIIEVYENTSTDELEKDSTNQFNDLIKDIQSTEINFQANATEYAYDVGDIVGVRENITNTFITRYIVKIIYKVKNGVEEISYSIG